MILQRVARWRMMQSTETEERLPVRSTMKRLLERLGFVHVAGWVRKSDAPAIQRKIEAARKDVERIKRDG